MSAQGGTLQRRGTIELPIWPVAILVVAAVAAALGMTLLGDTARTRFITSVTDSERLANSTAAVREQGAVAPTIDLTNSGVAIRHRGFAINESVFEPTTAVREQGATLPVVWGVSHVTPSQASFSGFENPGAYVDQAPAVVPGLENPGAYGDGFTPTAGGLRPNTEPCMQCK